MTRSPLSPLPLLAVTLSTGMALAPFASMPAAHAQTGQPGMAGPAMSATPGAPPAGTQRPRPAEPGGVAPGGMVPGTEARSAPGMRSGMVPGTRARDVTGMGGSTPMGELGTAQTNSPMTEVEHAQTSAAPPMRADPPASIPRQGMAPVGQAPAQDPPASAPVARDTVLSPAQQPVQDGSTAAGLVPLPPGLEPRAPERLATPAPSQTPARQQPPAPSAQPLPIPSPAILTTPAAPTPMRQVPVTIAPAAETGVRESGVRESVSLASDQRRVSELVGANVYNDANESVGEVDDIVFQSVGASGTRGFDASVIIQVGGFLGMGGRLVAVSIGELQWNAERERMVFPGATRDTLGARPEYRHPEN